MVICFPRTESRGQQEYWAILQSNICSSPGFWADGGAVVKKTPPLPLWSTTNATTVRTLPSCPRKRSLCVYPRCKDASHSNDLACFLSPQDTLSCKSEGCHHATLFTITLPHEKEPSFPKPELYGSEHWHLQHSSQGCLLPPCVAWFEYDWGTYLPPSSCDYGS